LPPVLSKPFAVWLKKHHLSHELFGAEFAPHPALMASIQSVDVTTRINVAIHTCLETFQPGRSAIEHLATFLSGLRSDPEWTDQEIKEVETRVRRILGRLVDEEDAGGW
jgi:hypothetical protein